MTITYLGEFAVGVAVPGAAVAVSAGMAGINAALDNLNAQLAALQAFAPVPINFAQQLTLAQSIVTGIQSAISLGLVPPDLSLQIAIIAAQIATLVGQITGIQANLDLLVDLQAPLAAAGVHGYAYDGNADNFGNELDGELNSGVPGGSGGSQHANGVVFVTTIPATWDAMGIIFKVAP